MTINANRLMKVLLDNGENPVSAEAESALEQCLDKLFPDIAFENGCLFMRTYNGESDPGNFSDKTEFEASQNEILINSEFPEKDISANFAFRFFNNFNERLPYKNCGKICSILSEDDGRWTFRFHIVREGEPLWISGDIENFSQPVLYGIFDKF